MERTLSEWLATQPKGTAARMMWDTGLSHATISRAKRGESINDESAELISEFTDGEVPPWLLTSEGADERKRRAARRA
jgi:hypothetical protein